MKSLLYDQLGNARLPPITVSSNARDETAAERNCTRLPLLIARLFFLLQTRKATLKHSYCLFFREIKYSVIFRRFRITSWMLLFFVAEDESYASH